MQQGRESQPMDMTGEYRIPAPRQRVWEALNDPEILKAAIPGCEELTKVERQRSGSPGRAKVGPVSATFTGKVTLGDLNPPESYRISGEGKGGAAGFAKGGAEVNLAEDGADTILRYSAKADVGGKLAQIGSRLIQGTAKKMADDFFGKFSTIVGERFATEQPAAPAPTLATPALGAGGNRRDGGAPARLGRTGAGADLGDAELGASGKRRDGGAAARSTRIGPDNGDASLEHRGTCGGSANPATSGPAGLEAGRFPARAPGRPGEGRQHPCRRPSPGSPGGSGWAG